MVLTQNMKISAANYSPFYQLIEVGSAGPYSSCPSLALHFIICVVEREQNEMALIFKYCLI